MLIDTHSHLNFDAYESVEQIIQNALGAGVEKIIIPGVEPEGYKGIIKLVEKHKGLYCSIGLHPSEALQYGDKLKNEMYELAKHPKVVAIGECGLDYYWDKSFIEEQKTAFIEQIKIANELNLPIIVHDRDAHQDTFDILKEHNNGSTVIMHCFSGSKEFVKECVKAGYYIALGGVVTFKNAKKVHEVAIEVPLENLLLETDSPYLTPEPHRGQRNEPAYVKYVAQKIAELRNVDIETISQNTSDNAIRAFNLDKS